MRFRPTPSGDDRCPCGGSALASRFDAHTLPFGHSEALADQERSVALCRRLGLPSLSHAEGHRSIVRRLGRFPHRNPILGRTTSAEEQRFLDEGGFAG